MDSLFTNNVDSLAYHLSRLLKDRSAASYRQHLMQGYSKRSRSWRVATREVTHSELQEMLRMPYLRTRNRNVSGFTTSRYIRRIRPYGSLAQRTIGSLRRDPDSSASRTAIAVWSSPSTPSSAGSRDWTPSSLSPHAGSATRSSCRPMA